MMRLATAARWLAILIGLLGALDPAVMSMRATRADVALVALNKSDSALGRQVADRLDKRFSVVRGPWDNAAATVVVGSTLPDRMPSGTVFGVREARPRYTVPYPTYLTSFDVPRSVTAEARFPVSVGWAYGRIELRANGVVVDTASADLSGGGRTFYVTPTAVGPLVISTTVTEGSRSVTAEALTNVVDRRSAVLFFDRRPSWMSTFVRRSLEQDRRFAVASRVVTSRNVSTDAGQPPSTLDDPSLLELYDVIVVGAPGSLTAADVAGLEAFLRRRGGAVVMLYDETPAAGAHDRLTGVTRWTTATSQAPVAARATDDTLALRFTESAWPSALPATAEQRATTKVNAAQRPIVWTNALGAGQVIVSGALDAWKFRDRSTSGFDEFWRATIARAASEAQDAVAIEVGPNLLEPGERTVVRVTLRDTLAKPAVMLDSTRLDVWPGERAGEFVARVPAPAIGEHWVRATAAGARAEAPVVVREKVQRLERNDWATIQTLATATGGMTGTLDQVESAVRAKVGSEQRMEKWWPMRTGWWIVPLALLLGFEWFVRRRAGLA